MPIIVDKDKKKQEIIEAATKVFIRMGYFRSKMQDIADEANIARGTIYLYFKDKDELILSCFEKYYQNYVARILSQLDKNKTIRENINSIIDECVNLNETDSNLYILYMEYVVYKSFENKTLQKSIEDPFDKVEEELNNAIKSFLQEKQEHRLLPELELNAFIDTINYSIDGIVFHLFTIGKKEKRDKVIQNFKTIINQCFI